MPTRDSASSRGVPRRTWQRRAEELWIEEKDLPEFVGVVDRLIEMQKAGASILRGGAFKPRTSPYGFRGLEEEGLKLLASARTETGLPVVTEVMSEATVEVVAKYADILQVGARNMQNFTFLKELGKASKPVLLKRGAAATIEELLRAAGRPVPSPVNVPNRYLARG